MPKPTTPKKAAKKKAKKEAGEKIAGPVSIRHLVGQALAEKQKGSKTTRIKVNSADDMQNPTLELPHLVLQYLFANRWFRCRTMTEIIGDEGVGKSTLSMVFAGMFGRIGAPVHLAETEAKMMSREQMIRAISPDKGFAERVYEEMMVTNPKSLELWFVELINVITAVRATGAFRKNKPAIKKDVEFLHIIDTMSKLMPVSEAANFYEGLSSHMLAAEKDKFRTLSQTLPTAIAKEVTSAMRRTPYLHEDLGLTMIRLAHKMVRREANPKPGDAKFAGWKDKRKPQTNGGNAPRQNASYRLALSLEDKSAMDSENNVFGKRVFVHMTKNAYGSDAERNVVWNLRTVYDHDTATYNQPVIEFDECLANMLVDRAILDVTVNNGSFSCRHLDAYGVTAKQLSEIIHSSPEHMQTIGHALRIQGYVGVPMAPPPPPPPPPSDVEEEEEEEEDAPEGGEPSPDGSEEEGET